jgi:hypothetical protein
VRANDETCARIERRGPKLVEHSPVEDHGCPRRPSTIGRTTGARVVSHASITARTVALVIIGTSTSVISSPLAPGGHASSAVQIDDS